MTRYIALTAVAFATLAGAASAATNVGELRKYASEAQIETLSPVEIAVLKNVIHSGDNEGQKRAQVQALLNN